MQKLVGWKREFTVGLNFEHCPWYKKYPGNCDRLDTEYLSNDCICRPDRENKCPYFRFSVRPSRPEHPDDTLIACVFEDVEAEQHTI